jgi:hypothetical protein
VLVPDVIFWPKGTWPRNARREKNIRLLVNGRPGGGGFGWNNYTMKKI